MSYKGSGYRAMNGWLRGTHRDDAWKNVIAELDKALGRARTKRPIAVFRGAANGSPFRTAQLGEVVADPGFLLTSIESSAAEHFGGDPPVVVEIRLPKGYVGGAYVQHVPKLQLNEHEFLIRPGAPFRVIGREDGRVILEPVRGKRRKAPALG